MEGKRQTRNSTSESSQKSEVELEGPKAELLKVPKPKKKSFRDEISVSEFEDAY